MNEQDQNPRVDPVDLLSEHYEATEMSDVYRRSILTMTRTTVAARRRDTKLRWTLGFAGVAVVLVALFLGLPRVQNVRPQHAAISLDKFARTPRGLGNAPIVHEKRTLAQPDSVVNVTNPPPTEHKPRLVEKPIATPDHSPVVVIVWAQGTVTDASGRALKPGQRVAIGSAIRTVAGARAALVTRGGSEIHLDGNTVLRFTAKDTAVIMRGRLYCANRNKEIARIDTPAGRVKLLGTVVDTSVVRKDTVAVTVVEGRVRLSNEHGSSLVDAGRRSVLMASSRPKPGVPVDTYGETAWYHGRGDYESDFGDVAYVVNQQKTYGLVTEIWTTNADGTDKHRVRTLIGSVIEPGPWVPGERWLSLDLRSPVWATPDVKTRSAAVTNSTQSRRGILDDRIVLLDAATGQTAPFELPDGYFVLRRSFAPNPVFMAFVGWYTPDPSKPSKTERGVWVCDRRSAKVTHVYNGNVGSPVAWAPDSRHIAISQGKFASTDCELLILDAQTVQVRDLGVQGAGASFSPDGTKIAYCGEFKQTNAWDRGVPVSGSIFVLDLVTPGAKPMRVSVNDDGALEPSWSPDGSRIAYIVPGGVCVVAADGTGPKEIYHVKLGMITKASWSPAGDAVFVTENLFTTLLVAADGSGVRRTISQMGDASDLPPDARQQTAAAAAAIKDAVFEYAMGQTLSFEGDLTASRHYAAAADTFAGLVWNYPLAGLAPDDTFRYADVARRAALRTPAEALHDTCRERMRLLTSLLAMTVAGRGHFPVDLQSCLSDYHSNWRVGDSVANDSAAHMMMLGGCPGDGRQHATPYLYNPPASGTVPKIGDVLVKCPLHPDVCLKWDAECERRFRKAPLP